MAPPAAAALAVLLIAAAATGQGRKTLRLTPTLTPASNFGGRLGGSLGLGGLQGSGGWSNSGPLRTTLYDPPRFGIARLGGRPHRRSPYAAPAPLGARGRSRLVAKPPPRVPIPFRLGPPSIRPARTAPETAISAKLDGSPARTSATVVNVTQGYVHAVRSSAGVQSDAAAIEITSLVPRESGLYRLYMSQGEQALRDGDVAKAAGQFRIAYDVGGHRPESLLALCHVRCIAGSYAVAAYHLQRALRALPELPLMPLRPAVLLGGEEVYTRVMGRLAGYIGRHPEDAEGHLLQAYLTWFEAGPPAARAALVRAEVAQKRSLSARKRPERDDPLLQAIQTLQSALPPEPATQPSRPG